MRRFLSLLRTRLEPPSAGALALTLWHLSVLLAIVAIPTLILLGRPLRGQPPDAQVQYWVWGAAYLLLSLIVYQSGRRGALVEAWVVPLQGIVVFALGYVALRYVAESTLSRKVAVASLAFSLAAIFAPLVLRRAFPLAIAGASALAAFGLWRVPPAITDTAIERVVVTALQPLTITEHHGTIDIRGVGGGAITAFRSGLLAVTAGGEFYRVEFPASPGRPIVHRLPLTIDFNRDSLFADSARVFRDAGVLFDVRTNDILIDSTVTPAKVYVSYKYWNPGKRCLTLRVSSAELAADGSPARADAWSTVYESSPCTAMTYDRGHGGFGSRLAWERPGQLLVTVGDFGYMGEAGDEGPQDPASPYGKVLRIDVASGRSSVFSLGHRNPQGLSVGEDGSVWSTEHGPQGGDEVNVLEAGANYGWPLASYGVQYGLDVWPLAKSQHDHGEFHEPAIAFTPSIGISNLIHLRSKEMPSWGDDILVGSLKDGGLFRLRRRGDRVITYERLQIGYRIRDLEQLPDGRVVLWTDGGAFVVLARATGRFGGAMRYAGCVGCHGEQLEGTAAGPSLRGVVGRPIASDPKFTYSPALRSLGGTWTTDRLAAFLRSPSSFAPGTTMNFEGMDREAVYQLLEYIRTFGPQP